MSETPPDTIHDKEPSEVLVASTSDQTEGDSTALLAAAAAIPGETMATPTTAEDVPASVPAAPPARDTMMVLGEQLILEYGAKARPEVLLRVSRNGHELIVASPEFQADKEVAITAIGR